MDNEQGWVPSNYLEEVKPAPVPTRRNKPPPPTIPTQKQQPERASTYERSSSGGVKGKYGGGGGGNNAPVAVFPGMMPVSPGSVPPWKAALEAKKNAAKANSTGESESDHPAKSVRSGTADRKPPPATAKKPFIPPKPTTSSNRPVAPPRPGTTGSKLKQKNKSQSDEEEDW
ncbi:9931_t:CDS:2 [Scutellospora calospora]|uniref:9931_t:CDS:1 n=1 Tax=Scutellospora calospora TaxID=85575 RepID=A0ACA9K6J2_9GLOM|nr:9931_t:CDS:2 [Scutellospora calospora]